MTLKSYSKALKQASVQLWALYFIQLTQRSQFKANSKRLLQHSCCKFTGDISRELLVRLSDKLVRLHLICYLHFKCTGNFSLYKFQFVCINYFNAFKEISQCTLMETTEIYVFLNSYMMREWKFALICDLEVKTPNVFT